MIAQHIDTTGGFWHQLVDGLARLDTSQWVFVIVNIIIVIGYLFVAIKVTPLLPVRLPTLVGGFAFFLLCAGTHGEQVAHLVFSPFTTWDALTQEEHMLLIHIPQAIAVWVFAVGFMLDLKALRHERHTTDAASG